MRYVTEKIRATSFTEVVAVTEEAANESLKKLRGQVGEEEGIEIVDDEIEEPQEVENPPEQVPQAFSQLMEMDMEFEDFPSLFLYLMKYGPSALEIDGPNEMEVSIREAQQMSNDVIQFIHRYAQQGLGGVVVTPE